MKNQILSAAVAAVAISMLTGCAIFTTDSYSYQPVPIHTYYPGREVIYFDPGFHMMQPPPPLFRHDYFLQYEYYMHHGRHDHHGHH